MTIQHTDVSAGHGVEYRINPKDKTTIEKRIGHNRWQVIRKCDTPQDARAYLFKLTGGRRGSSLE